MFSNDSPEGNGKQFLNSTEKIGVPFSKSISVKHQIFCEYDDELKGLTNYIWMWHNKNNDESAYNYWNFSKAWDWDNVKNPDNMWYHSNTSMLASSVRYKVGYESIEKINVAIEPVKNIHQDQIPVSSIFGFNIQWVDKVDKNILYIQSDDYNVDYLCPKTLKYNSTNIVFNLGMHFTESQYIHKFYTLSDVFATIGGLLSSISLVVS